MGMMAGGGGSCQWLCWGSAGVMGSVPRMMRPGPCLLPDRTSSGGLSRTEVKPGSSAACRFGRRGVCEMGLRGGSRAVAGELGWGHFANARPIGLCWVCNDLKRQADTRPAAMVSETGGRIWWTGWIWDRETGFGETGAWTCSGQNPDCCVTLSVPGDLSASSAAPPLHPAADTRFYRGHDAATSPVARSVINGVASYPPPSGHQANFQQQPDSPDLT